MSLGSGWKHGTLFTNKLYSHGIYKAQDPETFYWYFHQNLVVEFYNLHIMQYIKVKENK